MPCGNPICAQIGITHKAVVKASQLTYAYDDSCANVFYVCV